MSYVSMTENKLQKKQKFLHIDTIYVKMNLCVLYVH